MMLGEDEFSEAIDPASMFGIIESLPHPAALLGNAGQIIRENPAFRSLREQATPAICARDFFATLKSSDRTRIRKTVNGGAQNQCRTHRMAWQLPGKCSATLRAEVTPLTSGRSVIGFFCQLKAERSEQNSRLRYLMDNLDQGVWDYDLRTGVFTVSKSWRDLRGLALDHEIDLTNKDWLERIHPNDRDDVRAALDKQETGDEPSMVIQYRHLHRDGHWVWILCRSSVVERDVNGHPLRIVGTDTDISDAIENQESLRRLAEKLELAVEASEMGVWEFNSQTNKVHWDDRMLEIYGITDGQNARSGDIWETYLHKDDYDETVAYAEECNRLNRDFKRDYRIVTPGGDIRYVRSLARTVSAPNSAPRLIGVNIDITEDYQRARELENARFEAEQANLAKSHFLANMSHELRTPLNAIMGFSETMCLEVLGSMPPVYNEYATHINRSAQHLLAMIEQLLDLSKIEAGQMELSFDDVPLAALIGEVVQIVASAQDRPLTDFSIAPDTLDVTLRADARVMRQTLLNVVGNAAKFSDAGSTVTIEGQVSAEGISIKVRDEGIGIAAEDIASVFEPYNRSSSHSAKTRNGTGLGLPIARGLVVAHGGTLDLESELDVGSTVIISLPEKRIAGSTETMKRHMAR